jgi:hypothetical protein
MNQQQPTIKLVHEISYWLDGKEIKSTTLTVDGSWDVQSSKKVGKRITIVLQPAEKD